MKPKLDPWSTLLIPLFQLLLYTDGPILELGTGIYSTFVIHAFAINGREAISIEKDERWARLIKEILALCSYPSTHRVIVGPYEQAPIETKLWSVIIIDHEESRRRPDLIRARSHAEFILVHDTNRELDHIYKIQDVLDTFKFRVDIDDIYPASTVVSDTHELEWLKKKAKAILGDG